MPVSLRLPGGPGGGRGRSSTPAVVGGMKDGADFIPMADPLPPLLATAVVIGTVHTALGPDHYLPFVAMATAR